LFGLFGFFGGGAAFATARFGGGNFCEFGDKVGACGYFSVAGGNWGGYFCASDRNGRNFGNLFGRFVDFSL
jgi:hypothetical protein